MDKVQKIREEVVRLRNLHQMEYQRLDANDNMCLVECGKRNLCDNLLEFIDSLQEEPVSEDLEEAADKYESEQQEKYKDRDNHDFDNYRDGFVDGLTHTYEAFMSGAKWRKGHLWKPADGDDLPEIDREVIVLIKYYAQRNIHDKEYSTYRVGFGHRPNHDGWDGKNIGTNEVTHYTPKLYDKGGWNAPNIVYWLDVKLPKEIEL